MDLVIHELINKSPISIYNKQSTKKKEIVISSPKTQIVQQIVHPIYIYIYAV